MEHTGPIMWEVADAWTVTPEQCVTLEAWIAARRTPQQVVLRSPIVWLAASGMPNRRITAEFENRHPAVPDSCPKSEAER